MRLRMTVERATSPEPGTDVLVEAPTGTTLGEVWPRVAAVAGVPPDDAVAVVDPGGGAREVAATAPLGREPLLDGARLVARRPDWPAAGPPGHGTGAVTPATGPLGPALVAVSGPDAGRVHPLHRRGTVVGRHPSCDAVVADPDVSRRHCRVELTDAGARVTDLGSTNGTLVAHPRTPGGEQPAPVPAPVATGEWTPCDGGETAGVAAPLGSVVEIGSTSLAVRSAPRSPTGRPVAGAERGDGTVLHSPVPHRPPRPEPRVLTLPSPPTRGERRRIPWLAALLPVAVAAPLALWWGSAPFLMFGLLGPVMVVGSVVSDRRDGGRRWARDRAEHAAAVRRVEAEAAAAAADAVQLAQHTHPDLAQLLDAAVARSPRLWHRTLDDEAALTVRVGTADLPVPVRMDRLDAGGPGGRQTGPEIVVRAAPVTVDLAAGAAVVGPSAWARPLACGVVARLVAALDPDQLSVAVLAGTAVGRQHWSWTRWLPHRVATDPPGTAPAPTPSALAAVVAAADGERAGDHAWLVVVDGAPAEWLPALGDLGSRTGVHLLVVADGSGGVPSGWRTRLTQSGESGVGVTVTSETGDPVTGTADLPAPGWAERLARSLAPVRPPASRRGVPESVDLVAQLHEAARADAGAAHATTRHETTPIETTPTETAPNETTPADVAAWWSAATGRDGLVTPLGRDAGGRVDVDLVRHGPHTLVAGTTGAGKSELLRSLVLGLACRHPPDDLAFLLVDFKGGATFADVSALPHVLGTLTDLDQRAAGRVLASLGAELRRRERLLADAGVADLAAVRRRPRPEPDPASALPRLVVVLDEFRVLAEEAPAVLDRLVRLATVGRSLGVHLVLATQRPAGVVSADIRANTSLRVALRVADAAESTDVVGVADAAALPAAAPGRAVMELGGRRLTVQTARATRDRDTRGVRVVALDAAPPAGQEPHRPGDSVGTGSGGTGSGGNGGGSNRTDSTDSTEAPDPTVTSLVAACRAAVDLTGRRPAAAPWLPPLPAVLPAGEPVPSDTRPTTGGPSLPLAVLDVPAEQCRTGLHWRPADDGPLLVLGGPRSGRSTTLATLAVAATGAGTPAVVLSGDRGAPWPDCAQVVDWRDADHLDDALAALARRADTRPEGWACVLVDDVDALTLALSDRPDTADLLAGLVRDGAAGRVALAMAGGRQAAGHLGGSTRVRLLLRPAEPSDAALVGLSPRDLPAPMPPGRCVVTGIGDGDGLEGQVPLPARDGGPGRDVSGPTPAVVPPPLPHTVRWGTSVRDAPSGRWPSLPVGVGVDGERAGVLSADVGRGLAVVGPPRSGRTTALTTLADSAGRLGADVVVLVSPSRSDGRWPDPARPLTPEQARAELSARQRSAGPHRPVLVLLDDLDDADPDAEDLVCDVLAGGLGAEVAAVAAGSTAWFAASFRGVAAAGRRLRRGLLLHPGRRDARDVLGVAVPAQQSRLPGRGVLVRPGSAVRVQVAEHATALSRPPAGGVRG